MIAWYVNTCGFPTVAVVDVKTQAKIGSIVLPDGFGTNPMAISPDGKLGYTGDGFCGGPPNIEVLDLKTNSVLATIPTSKNVLGLALSRDGKVALAGADDRILVIDLTTNTEVGPVTSVVCGGVCCVQLPCRHRLQ